MRGEQGAGRGEGEGSDGKVFLEKAAVAPKTKALYIHFVATLLSFATVMGLSMSSVLARRQHLAELYRPVARAGRAGALFHGSEHRLHARLRPRRTDSSVNAWAFYVARSC